jgi:hypothetical protein
MTNGKKPHSMQKWILPHTDENGQWWWGYQKVRKVVLPESEKQKFLKSLKTRENINGN